MIGIEVDIICIADNSQPGWVKCVFKDIHDKEWTIIEKLPVVSDEYLSKKSQFPLKGFVAGSIVSERYDANNNKIVLFSTEMPWDINAETGEAQFEVFADQIIVT